MSIYQAVLDFIGEVPAGYEPLIWVVCSVILLFLLQSAFSIIGSLMNWVSGR